MSLAVLTAILALPGVVTAASGSTVVNVKKCVQVGKDIKVTNGASTYTLISSCRDAGYGPRDYKMTCISATKYQVNWKDGCTLTIPKPTDIAPSVFVSIVDNVGVEDSYFDLKTVSTDDVNGSIKKIELYQVGKSEPVSKWTVEGNESTSGWLDYQSKCVKNVCTRYFGFNLEKFGAYSYYVKAYDNTGHSGVSNYITINHNVNPPTVDLKAELLPDTGSGYGVRVTVDASAVSPLTQVRVWISDLEGDKEYQNWNDVNATNKTITKVFEKKNLKYGITYYISAVIEDKDKNYKAFGGFSSVKLAVPADVTAPTISVVKNKQTITATATDASGKIKNISIYFGSGDTKDSLSLVATCSNLTSPAVCKYDFAGSGGFFYAKAENDAGKITETDLNYFFGN